MKVCKFGGSSLATREKFEQAIDILRSDKDRRFVVVSAPGKINAGDTKVTDLLIKRDFQGVLRRFGSILEDVPEGRIKIERALGEWTSGRESSEERVKAFGEYASAIAMTELIRRRGIDAVLAPPHKVGFFVSEIYQKIQPDPSCYESLGDNMRKLAGERRIVVFPGFYGFTREGVLKTLPRNGSDTSGAVVARAVGAFAYENWTDEDGLKSADPRIVHEPRQIPEITYREARELAYMGFKLQADALIPLLGTHTPLHIRNADNLENNGTLVVEERIVPDREYVVGVAAKPGFLPLSIEKILMNEEPGFGADVFAVMREQKIPYEHSPTGIDNMSIIINAEHLREAGTLDRLIRDLNKKRGPLQVSAGEPLAMLAVAGLGIRRDPAGVAARTLGALRKSDIQCYMLNMGASDISFFVGVAEGRADDAVRAVYSEFFE